VRRIGEAAMGGRFATRWVVLMLGTVEAATGMSLMALTDRVHSDGAISPAQNTVLLMVCNNTRRG
jgi:hypothetical protein